MTKEEIKRKSKSWDASMDEYAEQECIGFAEWIDDGLMFMAHDDRWVNVKDGSRPTTKELYQLYLKSKQQP